MANINKQTIESVHKQLVAKEVSATELTQAYLEQIEQKDKDINAYINITADKALEAAKEVDAAIAAGQEVSMIAGVPAALKDNFNWTDTLTTAGSNMLGNYMSPYNATVTERMLADKAVFLGKANMDAFAHGSSTETSDFGVTKNPFNLERVAGGSSGGSAAAVAADMAAYAIGSETAGSVRGPAAWCNLYGFAPTYGRISRYGVVAMGSSLDRPGVLAHTVADCAIVTDVIAGKDERDATTIPEGKTSYFANLSTDLKGKNGKLRLGLPKQFMDSRIQPEVSAAVMNTIKELEEQGAEIVEIDLLDPKYSIAVYTIICRSEVSSNLARIDGIRYGFTSPDKAAAVLDQISLNRGQGFGNEAKQRSMTGAYALSAGYYDAYYKKAQQVRTLIIDDFKRAFNEVDLIVGPTMPTTAPKLGVTANDPLFGETADMLTEPSALAGLPCISLPVGFDNEGLPIGMQVFGPQFAEQQVLNLAYLYEQKIAN
jgi:aspartyl-tRNA(Asn)/glutamyl-tRNA(Gln) amidotransferase subunit A